MNILSSMLNFVADSLSSISTSISSLTGRMTTAETSLTDVSGRVTNFYVFRYASIIAQTDASALSSAAQDILSRELGDITFICYVFRTGEWQLNGYGSVRNGVLNATFVNGYNGQILIVSKTSTTAIQVVKTL